MQYMTESELYHHGILGQKWGVRRYQNQDGSYTAAGKERYGIEDGKRRSMVSYAIERHDQRENKRRYQRMKRNQNLDTMSYDELKRLQERESLKGQIQWQQKQNDPKSWKKDLRQQMLKNFMSSAAAGAGQELGKQIINAPVRLAAFTGNKAVSAASFSAKELVGLATDTRRQRALSNTVSGVRDAGRYLNRPGYREYRRVSDNHGQETSWSDYNRRLRFYRMTHS